MDIFRALNPKTAKFTAMFSSKRCQINFQKILADLNGIKLVISKIYLRNEYIFVNNLWVKILRNKQRERKH